MLADLNAGHIGRDWGEFAADFVWGIRLEVPGVLVGGAAPHEEEDAGLSAAERALIVVACGGAIGEQLWQCQAEQAERAGG